MLVVIDGREVRTEGDLHRLLGRALDFGPYYGSNLDALRDRLEWDVPARSEWSGRTGGQQEKLGTQGFKRICNLLRAA
ncbi:barstar family protein [Micromonospora chersina]|uniref:barstar family protein n=1 Tax=Micromonospora chersina TaxID=47854 RepID=UPI0037B2D568